MCILAKLRWCLSGCVVTVYYNNDLIYEGSPLDLPDEFNQYVVIRLFAVSAGVLKVIIDDPGSCY